MPPAGASAPPARGTSTDPRAERVRAALLQAWGLPVDLSGLERFAMTCVEAFAGRVAVVKPQSAFFEVFGSRGVAVLERVLADLRDAGTDLLTITQYLRPSSLHHPIERWVAPEEFAELEDEAKALGYAGVLSGPLVRSSYRAGRLYRQAIEAHKKASRTNVKVDQHG